MPPAAQVKMVKVLRRLEAKADTPLVPLVR